MASVDSSSTTLSTCLVCRRIATSLEIFDSSHPDVVEIAGSIPIGDILSPDFCAGHTRMLQAMLRGKEIVDAEIRQVTLRDAPQCAFNFEAGGDVYFPLEVELANRAECPNHAGKGLILDSQWVDMEVVRQWKAICLETHGAKCHNPLTVEVGKPSWLIDTELDCLVKGGGQDSYVALSYRWAGSSGLQTSISTLERLQRPGELRSPENALKIPETVRNAMSLVRSLGERYLWVDALCIVQDDEASKMHDINLMASIYASAIITIIAADGNADYGLRGLRGISRPRSFEQRVHPFYEENIMETEFSITKELYLNDSEYAKRGWTFQEYYMSARRLIFFKGMLHWECSFAVWHEDRIPSAVSIPIRSHSPLGRMIGLFPNMTDYLELADGFNQRCLTYDNDALNAVSGLFNVLSQGFEGGFLSALPEMFFDLALSWDARSDMRRRESATSGDSVKRMKLPSWSWIGWHGGVVDLNHDIYTTEVSPSITYEETFPITEWYTSETPHALGKQRIRCRWFDYKNYFKDVCMLPPGWVRRSYVPRREAPRGYDLGIRPSYPLGSGKYYFTHSSFPNETFWHPVPILDNMPSTPLSMSQSTPYISCQTYRAWFLACPRAHVSFKGRFAILKNRLGKNVGELRLNRSEDMMLLGPEPPEVEEYSPCHYDGYSDDSESLDEDVGKSIELVAICGSTCVDSLRGGKRKSYHVLWVEWEEGVAYRRGHGMVKWSAWEAECPEPVTLILG